MPAVKPVLLRLPKDLEEWLKQKARDDERSFNAYCRRILEAQRTREQSKGHNRQELTYGAGDN